MAILTLTFPSIISELMHRALNTVQSWHRGKEPSVNLDKTEHLLFIKNKVERFIASVLLNKLIHPTGSVEYVGVIQNAKLTWRQHVKQRLSNAYSSLWLCCRTITRPGILCQKMCFGFIQVQEELCLYV
jgi:hypothetical protein